MLLCGRAAANVLGSCQVLENRAGIPITLALVYMEVARRVGFEVVGLNVPGERSLVYPVIVCTHLVVKSLLDLRLIYGIAVAWKGARTSRAPIRQANNDFHGCCAICPSSLVSHACCAASQVISC